jgi:hypothetical protein
MNMARQTRSDATVGTVEKQLQNKLGVPVVLHNPDGRNTRSDKQLGTVRSDAEKSGTGVTVKTGGKG